MIIHYGSCENMVDFFDRKVQITGMFHKLTHLGIIKIWRTYETYVIIDGNSFVKDYKTGKTLYGKHLSSIEIVWGWKK